MSDTVRLDRLTAGMMIPFGGNRGAVVPAELAEAFQAGDRLVVVQSTGALLHIPSGVADQVSDTVGGALHAFHALSTVSDEQITEFFRAFAERLSDDLAFAEIAAANAEDVADAERRGRSTTRLQLSPSMRADMISGLLGWCTQPAGRDLAIGTVDHQGWSVEQRRGPLGVIGFVFEGRPNVFADATGVLRTGNTVVFRIGSDALRTARAIMRVAVEPAIASAGLPRGAVGLVDSVERSAGWALFADQRLALAVARGSGEAVEQLGGVARQSGVPVSLHGTGGAWLIAAADADPVRLSAAAYHSLDRKVCNTLNVCCVIRSAAAALVPVFLDALQRAGERRGTPARLHVVGDAVSFVPADWLTATVGVQRAEGVVQEPIADLISVDQLGTEWEWETSPEVSLVLVDDLDEAVGLFNRWSPRFAISLISANRTAHDQLWATVDSPFVGDGMTRWVDGQFALSKPELGLSNWQHGRLFARSGILSGDSAFTVRLRATQTDVDLHR
jgi:glutamate-5-semialdehyde dehydrogenase